MSARDEGLMALAERAVWTAVKAGAKQAAADAYRVRDVQLNWRDGKAEKVSEAVSRALDLQLFVDGRYASVSTSDLRPDALARFIGEAIAVTRTLAIDPHRALPERELYLGRSDADLELSDARHAAITPAERRRVAQAIEAGARAVDGKERILSVEARYGDTQRELARVASNDFRGERRSTYFSAAAAVSVQDPDGRRPELYRSADARHFDALEDPAALGRRAAEGALGRIGAQKGKSATMPVVVDNRVAGRLVSFLLAAATGRQLQQKQSFLDGKLDRPLGSPRLTVGDDPLRKRGLGSQPFDGEGMAARARPIFSDGTLRTWFLDTYYARKLGLAPTTMRWSNLDWRAGDRPQAALIADAGEGVFITAFIGGNSNTTTGDFSLGFQGRAIHGGKLGEPLGEMNLSGNHLELWKRLAALGDDPFECSSLRTPTMLFDGVQVAGV